MKMLHAAAKQRGVDHEWLRRYAEGAYDVDSLTKLSREQAKEMIDELRPSRDGWPFAARVS